MYYSAPAVVSASSAKTTTGNSSRMALGYEAGANLNLLADITAVSGVTPTLDLSVEWSHDGGTTWAVAEAADTFSQVTAAKTVVKQFAVKGPDYRVKWTIAGTAPSFTFSVRAYVTD